MAAAATQITTPVAANSAALTYVNSLTVTAAQQAGPNTYRITAAGGLLSTLGLAGGNGVSNGQSAVGAALFNIHAGANGNVSDPIILSVADNSISNTNNQWLREFMITVRANQGSNPANGFFTSAMTTPASRANVSLLSNTATPNINVAQTNHIGLSVQVLGTPVSEGLPSTWVMTPTNLMVMNVEQCLCEQVI